MTELPKVIYLQVWGDGDKSEGLPETNEHITWCADKVFDSDVKYILDKLHLRPKVREA